MKVLIVEDEKQLAKNIAEILSANHILADIANSAEDAKDKIDIDEFDAIILDWMLPGISGISFLQALRKENKSRRIFIFCQHLFKKTHLRYFSPPKAGLCPNAKANFCS